MNIEYFKYLQTVTQCRSIRQAADRLHLKQQNLSVIIKNMETYYGITLFDRTQKGITLTKDGHFFMEQVETILSALQVMESTYLYPSKKEYSSVVQDINIYMQDIITSDKFVTFTDEFHKYFPYVNISLMTERQHNILEQIEEDEETIGLLYSAHSNNFLQQLQQKNLQATPYLRGQLTAITNKQNKQAQQLKSISIHQFLQKDLVLYAAGKPKDNVLYQLLCSYGTPNIKYTVNNGTFFADLLQKNDYWSIGRVDHNMKDKLLSIPFEEDLFVQSYFVYNQEAAQSFIVQSFLKMAVDLLDTFEMPYLIR